MNYKFNEDKLIQELKSYVDKTYDQHYATDKYQATDIIIDSGHGTGFCLGNVIKYAKRYGNKGTAADARKDLMKIMHYALIQLDVHDQEHRQANSYNELVDLDHAPTVAPGHYYNGQISAPKGTTARLNDATPEEWDRATKMEMAFNPNGVSRGKK